MKKKFDLDEVDCANCAAKMEDAIKKIDGVTDARVNFLTQKMTIEALDDIFESVVDKAVKVIAKVEPDCEVIRK
ncbi:MAG: cation transporter [Lachnospiraceae bacterium]|nr:cation transporter [Lachnospiraceae bacterium]MEE3460529.1 cation transporter [Lachnospiraceae bacterium]